MTNEPRRAERLAPRAALALALGGLHARTFAPPLDHWWLQLALLACLFALLPRARAARASRSALVVGAFGLGWFGAGLSWLHTSMHVYGGMPSALAVLAVLLFALYLSLFPAGACAVAAWLDARWSGYGSGEDAAGIAGRGTLVPALSLGACWAASEILKGWLFTGFPWLSIGYAQIDGPLAGFAPWLGVYGIGMVTVTVSWLLAACARQALARASARRGDALPALGLAALAILAGAALARAEPTEAQGAPVSVRLVQGNVPQQMKFDRSRTLQAMLDYTELIDSGRAQLTVLPETAWTAPWAVTPASVSERIAAALTRSQGAIAIGMPMLEARDASQQGRARFTNSVALLRASAGAQADLQILARYDKRHLVPFGEFVPSGFGWFVRMMSIPLGEFARGAASQPAFEVGGQRFSFNVCYEDLFGEELIESVRPPVGASVLVNVSNIAWFGDSHALPQHLAIARMRTLETGRPMIRATNTGVTAAIDHRGRVLGRLPAYTRAALDVSVQGTSGLTAYARLGNALPLTVGALALLLARLLAGVAKRRRR